MTGASILESADLPDEAAELIEFLLGEDAQTFFTDETFEYPLVDGRRADRASSPSRPRSATSTSTSCPAASSAPRS